MANELENYISDALRKGYSEGYIRQSLLSQGWQPIDINQAFASMRMGPQSAQPSQPAQAMQPQSIVSKPRSMKLRKIGVFSSAKISAMISLVIGLICGILFTLAFGTLISSLVPLIETTSGGADTLGLTAIFASLAAYMIVVIPLVFAISGFIFGAIFALIYNLMARVIGGYEVEFE